MSDRPSPKPALTKFEHVAVFVVLALGSVALLLPLLPGQPPTVVSAWGNDVRNYGLVIAAAVGFALAYWRILQTERQFAASQSADRLKADRDTFREGAHLLTNDDDAIGLAGVTLLRELENGKNYSVEAAALLNGYTESQRHFCGDRARDRALVDRASSQNIVFFRNVCFEGLVMRLKGNDTVGERCYFEDCTFERTLLFLQSANYDKTEFRRCAFPSPLTLSGRAKIFESTVALDPAHYDAKIEFNGCFLTSKTFGFSSGDRWVRHALENGCVFQRCGAYTESSIGKALVQHGIDVELISPPNGPVEAFFAGNAPGYKHAIKDEALDVAS